MSVTIVCCDVCSPDGVAPEACRCSCHRWRMAPVVHAIRVTCAIVACPGRRSPTVGEGFPGSVFCISHEAEFMRAPEAAALRHDLVKGLGTSPYRATAFSDFRDRLWKEHCVVAEAEKRAAAAAQKSAALAREAVEFVKSPAPKGLV